MVDTDFSQFIVKVKRKTGIDLFKYKEDQMKRRLISLYKKHGFKNFEEYFEAMNQNKETLDEFLDRVTINVTEFFRNPSRWEVLQNNILPRLAKEKGSIKSWSAACSTGEEPYSLAILLKEMKLNSVTVLATDLDLNVLNTARQGIYGTHSVQEVSEAYKGKYFIKRDKGYEVSDHLKKSVQFKKQDLLADSFDSNFDLIICRNVMIYFTEEAKDELYKKFAGALRTGGVLFVGSTEQIFQSERYQLVPEDTFFYRKV